MLLLESFFPPSVEVETKKKKKGIPPPINKNVHYDPASLCRVILSLSAGFVCLANELELEL